VDDRLPVAPPGRIERGDGIVEGRVAADVCPQSPIAHSLDDLIQLGAIDLDDEVDRLAINGRDFDRADSGQKPFRSRRWTIRGIAGTNGSSTGRWKPDGS
jgi:hypothetical protein